MFAVNKNPTVKDLRKFGLAMLTGFGVIGALLWISVQLKAEGAELLAWSGAGLQITAVCLWAVGVGLFALSLLSLTVAKPVYVAWMTAAMAIGTVMSTILLTVLFVLLLPPFSLIVRMGDPLRKKLKPGDTYWEDCKPHEATLERMRRPF